MPTPEESTFPHGSHDPIVKWMLQNEIAVTRANYLDLSGWTVDDPRKALDAELEELIPDELRA